MSNATTSHGSFVDEPRALLQGLRRGDEDAFETAYRTLRPAVVGYIRRLGAPYAVAEELGQETMLRLARHARALHSDTHLRAWVFTVARNLMRDYQRRLLLDRDRTTNLDPRKIHDVRWASPVEAHEANETARQLERALPALPKALRESLILCAIEGFKPSVAAAMVGVSPETMRQRLSRARAQLAVSLDDRDLEMVRTPPDNAVLSGRQRRAFRSGLSHADRVARKRSTVVVFLTFAQVVWSLAKGLEWLWG